MQTRAADSKRDIDGVLLFDKGAGVTSNAVLQRVRRLYRARKAGHTGTLDPFATGLLPICLGEATKFGAGLLDADKAYHAGLRLGLKTDTGDCDGRVLQVRPVAVTLDAVESVLERFRGPIDQTPPMHSALKRDGKPLYAYARAGIEVERSRRPVVIHALTVRCFDPPALELEVVCSKGTYVRALADDIGDALGCGAHLASLCRTRVGPLGVADAVDWDRLESLDDAERDALLMPADVLVAAYPEARVDAAEQALVLRGQRLIGQRAPSGTVRLYGPGQRFLGLGEQSADGILRPRRLIRPAGPAARAPESQRKS